jgi:hypothetical protein
MFAEARQNAAVMVEILFMAANPLTDIAQMNSGTAQTIADREIRRMSLVGQNAKSSE